jgi:hypothetical protein
VRDGLDSDPVKLALTAEQAMSLPDDFIAQHVQRLAMIAAERHEREVRTRVERWLPRPLRWLIDHPRALALYLRLPHRWRPVAVQQPNGQLTMEIHRRV